MPNSESGKGSKVKVALQIPDSPIWLLKRDREEAAIRSLCWLRGWVKEDSVKTEFEDMRSYIKNSRIRISGLFFSFYKIYEDGLRNIYQL